LNHGPHDERVIAEVRHVAPSGPPELTIRTGLAGTGCEGGEHAVLEFGEWERLTLPSDAMGEMVHFESSWSLNEPETPSGRGRGPELGPPTIQRIRIRREDHDRSKL
jgi:hypothetical protein